MSGCPVHGFPGPQPRRVRDVYTVRWEERFRVAAITGGYSVELVTRNVARSRICGGSHANDTYVRRALVERFGKDAMRGTTVHSQAALAVAIVAAEMIES